jgi:uncharacterized protein (TIGR02453 family)
VREATAQPAFGPELFSFLSDLAANNDREWFAANRHRYEDHLLEPALAFIDAFATPLEQISPHFRADPRPSGGSLFRIYRDTRFSKDKSPYKTHQGAFVDAVPGVGYYVQVSADGLLAAAGFHSHGADQIDRYRDAVDNDATGKHLESIVATLRESGFDLDGDALKTRPKAYPADHPRIELLRYRSIYAERSWQPQPWIHTASAAARVREAWSAAQPLVAWITEHVGQTHEPSRRRP